MMNTQEHDSASSKEYAGEEQKVPSITGGTVGGAAETVANQTVQAKEAAEGRFRQARQFAAEKVRQIREAASERATEIRDYAVNKAAEVRRKAGEGWDNTCDQAREFHEMSEEYVKAHPTKSVLVAFVVGLLVGFLIRRR